MSSPPQSLLVLFDIDGTLLLKAHLEHGEALRAAIHRVHAVDIPERRVEAAGRTDGAIARSVLLLAGVPDDVISEKAPAVRAAACAEYARRCPEDLTDRLAPGVEQMLSALGGARLSLVTGNLEPIARLKLNRAGIGRHFEPGQGGFGSDSDDRSDLPPIARRRAGLNGRAWPRSRTVVIGDTPRDIACARADGLRCIAVATGPFAAADLDAADAVVGSAAEIPQALAALG